jgi:hypothetical protein
MSLIPKEISRALRRAWRVGLAVGVAQVAASCTGQPWLLLLAPVLNGVAKYLRDKAGVKETGF